MYRKVNAQKSVCSPVVMAEIKQVMLKGIHIIIITLSHLAKYLIAASQRPLFIEATSQVFLYAVLAKWPGLVHNNYSPKSLGKASFCHIAEASLH